MGMQTLHLNALIIDLTGHKKRDGTKTSHVNCKTEKFKHKEIIIRVFFKKKISNL